MTIVPEQNTEGFNPPNDNRLYPELFALHQEIHGLSVSLEDLERLLEIQKRLIIAVSEAEKEIKAAKKDKLDPRDWQYVRYNFLCLGDSIAFLYIDRFALKQTFYNTDTYLPKQNGGFITGKQGLASELSVLMEAIAHNVPAVLCDLTNVVRYGDVCLLEGSDPVPIEVKSSSTKDRRSKRQKKKLKTVTEYLETDRAQNFRGIPGTTFRLETSAQPRCFSDLVASAITEALSVGTATFEVDECLTVAVIAEGEPDYGILFGDMSSSRMLGNFVNEIKNNRIWGCYFPYALTLANLDHYERFIRGEISIICMLNLENFETKLTSIDVNLEVEANENEIFCHINFLNLSDELYECKFKIGEHMMCRMWTDFLYPSWIVQNTIDTLRKNVGLFSAL